jgi:hypothetical protein
MGLQPSGFNEPRCGLTPHHPRRGGTTDAPGRPVPRRPQPIHKLHHSTTVTVLLLVGFNLVMLPLLEVPLASFLVAPDWTPRAVERATFWVSRHAHALEVRGLTALDALPIVKGPVGLIS